ncbi:uncharacterized protein LOC124114010 [Haliotis rufescens]|uniref:uncharacterized protein LOC124114010 n=1 Tax=Haliotis rufescens TaxID=6454 RepID=UPI001EB010A8|nr:uncharacterized protein LOC124114010 [Haliotis rufescens]XP_046330485.1 uncharacterized protein LOC124114010 [Haliotis rufescens]XP_046330486.1 uncharacterized protein LOC124114010 [Haliotis rufescens]XP_046330487.1 uncharacterized protein LOC124114010 [Haliotis rufescens]
MDEKVLKKMDELERYEKVVKHLGERYDQSKGVSPLFRYGQLKSMIKAAILKMSKDNEDDSDGEDQETSKPDLKQMSNTRLTEDFIQKRRQVKAILKLKDEYAASKRLGAFVRYGELKSMIKRVTRDTQGGPGTAGR